MKDYNRNFKYSYMLDKLNSKIFTKKIISFDVETHNNNQDFTLGDIYDGVTHQTFYDRKKMRDKLLKTRYQNTLLVATNLLFDFCSLEEMEKFRHYDIISRGSRFIQVKKKNRYKYAKKLSKEKLMSEKEDLVHVTFSNTFVDSLNHYAGSVQSAGKIIGLNKMDSPAFLGKEPKDRIATAIDDNKNKYEVKDKTEWEYLTEYNQRDTEVTYGIMNFLQNTYNELGCEMKTTISSTALNLWRRKYLPQTLYKEDFILGKSIKDKLFDSYYGGRTEIFGRGLIESSENSKWKLLDFNSLYPSVMINEYPLPQSIREIVDRDFSVKNIEEFEGVSEVEVECDEMFYPILPYRDIRRGKLIFPVGRWRGSYTHLELRKALENGYRINKIYSQYIYTKTFFPFKDYVLDLYAKRLEYQKEKNPMEVVVKLLLNSLYGKLAQKDFTEYNWFDIENMSEEEYNRYLNSNNTTTFNNIGFERVTKECDTNFIFPILPSYVTSYGRLKLYDALVKYKGVYADTDSVITKMDCETSNKLGDLKVEDRLKKAILIRPKMYMKVNDKDLIKIKVKGLPKANYEQFESIIQGKNVYFDKFVKPNESIRRGFSVNSVRQENKKLTLEDNKRVWSSKFSYDSFDFDSKPLKIDEPNIFVKGLSIRKSVKERMLIAEQLREREEMRIQKQFIESDLFDSKSVGKDISHQEFLDNEKWFERFE